MFRRADGIDVEQRRPTRIEAVDIAFDEVVGVGDGAGHHVGGAMRHADQADLLARLLLAALGHTERCHVGHLADEARGARLAAGVGIHLRVDHQHLDRHAGHERARQVLEADVVHGAVAADGDHRRAKQPLLFGKLLPGETTEEVLVLVDGEFIGEFQFGHAHRLEALRHLRHVALEDAHRHRRAVLEQVAGPGEGIGVEGIGRAPHRGATGRVDDAHLGTAAAGRPLDIAPLQVLQLLDELRRPLHPGRIERPRRLVLHDLRRQAGQRQILSLRGTDCLQYRTGVGEIHRLGQLHADVLLQAANQVVQVRDMLFHARLHQRRHGAGEQVDGGLFAATQAGAVAAGHRAVVALVEQ